MDIGSLVYAGIIGACLFGGGIVLGIIIMCRIFARLDEDCDD